MENTYKMRSIFIAIIGAFLYAGAFGAVSTEKLSADQVKKELPKIRSKIEKLAQQIENKKVLWESKAKKDLADMGKLELRLQNRDIQLNPAEYVQKREPLEDRRKALKEQIAKKEKAGVAPAELHAELTKVNSAIDKTKTIYEIRADRNRDLDFWKKDQEKSIGKELEKSKTKFQQQGLSGAEIQKKIDDLSNKEKETLKNKINNLKMTYDKELLGKYGYEKFLTPTREEIERVAKEEINIMKKTK